MMRGNIHTSENESNERKPLEGGRRWKESMRLWGSFVAWLWPPNAQENAEGKAKRISTINQSRKSFTCNEKRRRKKKKKKECTTTHTEKKKTFCFDGVRWIYEEFAMAFALELRESLGEDF